MSKKYKGKTCAYCGVPNSSESADHVVAREFFLVGERANLPKVPACRKCNSDKSALELYALCVLPFGGTHRDAVETLATKVVPRLERNSKILEELRRGMTYVLQSQNGGPWQVTATLPFDHARILSLFNFITRGLAVHHFDIHCPPSTCFTNVSYFNDRGRNFYRRLLQTKMAQSVRENLGNGVFEYEGCQSALNPQFTLWNMSLLGAQLGGSMESPGAVVKEAYAVTHPMGWRSVDGNAKAVAEALLAEAAISNVRLEGKPPF